MIANVVSRRYAKALVEIVRQDGRLDTIRDELKEVNDIINGEPGLFHFLSNPAVGISAKRDVLNTIVQKVGASDLTVRFLDLLLEKDRLKYLETVLFFYEELSYQIQNRLKARVVSASPLGHDQRDEIVRKLSAMTGRQVELVVDTDPDLIGGLVVQVGSTIYDGSLRNQLSRIKRELLEA